MGGGDNTSRMQNRATRAARQETAARGGSGYAAMQRQLAAQTATRPGAPRRPTR